MNSNRFGARPRRGNTWLEYAVLMLVIVAVGVAAPIVWNGQAADARKSRAGAELESMAAAQAAALELLGGYLPLQVLDDPAPGATGTGLARDSADAEPGSVRVIPPSGEVGADQEAFADRAAAWTGPLHQPRAVWLGPGGAAAFDVGSVTADRVTRDWPLDPWGSPYRLYGPSGVVGTRAAESSTEALESAEFSDGVITTADDRFDAWALVSWGPDGVSDSQSGIDDDVIYFMTEAGDAAE